MCALYLLKNIILVTFLKFDYSITFKAPGHYAIILSVATLMNYKKNILYGWLKSILVYLKYP